MVPSFVADLVSMTGPGTVADLLVGTDPAARAAAGLPVQLDGDELVAAVRRLDVATAAQVAAHATSPDGLTRLTSSARRKTVVRAAAANRQLPADVRDRLYRRAIDSGDGNTADACLDGADDRQALCLLAYRSRASETAVSRTLRLIDKADTVGQQLAAIVTVPIAASYLWARIVDGRLTVDVDIPTLLQLYADLSEQDSTLKDQASETVATAVADHGTAKDWTDAAASCAQLAGRLLARFADVGGPVTAEQLIGSARHLSLAARQMLRDRETVDAACLDLLLTMGLSRDERMWQLREMRRFTRDALLRMIDHPATRSQPILARLLDDADPDVHVRRHAAAYADPQTVLPALLWRPDELELIACRRDVSGKTFATLARAAAADAPVGPLARRRLLTCDATPLEVVDPATLTLPEHQQLVDRRDVGELTDSQALALLHSPHVTVEDVAVAATLPMLRHEAVKLLLTGQLGCLPDPSALHLLRRRAASFDATVQSLLYHSPELACLAPDGDLFGPMVPTTSPLPTRMLAWLHDQGHARFGTDPDAWRTLADLHDGWTGTYDELLDCCAGLADGS